MYIKKILCLVIALSLFPCFAVAKETPVEEKVGDWDFLGAAELLGRVQFEEEELAARTATRRDELARLATLKKKIIAKVNATETPLKKTDLMLRGMGGSVTGADESGVTTTLISGKDESIPWGNLGQKATSKLLEITIDRDSADDWLAGGLLAIATGDVILVKGPFVRKLRRLMLTMQGRQVRCQAESCSLKGLTCDRCPLLGVDTRQLDNPLVTRYLDHREAA